MAGVRWEKFGSVLRRLFTWHAAAATERGPLYIGGLPNPARTGFISIRATAGAAPKADDIDRAARLLGVPVRHVDAHGYECEVVATATGDASGYVAYVRTRARETRKHVEIDIRVHLRSPDGVERTWPIESYNAYFGCDVRYFEWIGPSAILIYREKHHSFVCRITPGPGPRFVEIEDAWIVHGRTLAYRADDADRIQCLSLPELHQLASLDEDAARAASLLPPLDG